MPRKLRIQSGKEVVKTLERYGFVLERIKGSHVRLSLSRDDDESFHITIPLHSELRKGTLRGIISELEKYIKAEDLKDDFYTK